MIGFSSYEMSYPDLRIVLIWALIIGPGTGFTPIPSHSWFVLLRESALFVICVIFVITSILVTFLTTFMSIVSQFYLLFDAHAFSCVGPDLGDHNLDANF